MFAVSVVSRQLTFMAASETERNGIRLNQVSHYPLPQPLSLFVCFPDLSLFSFGLSGSPLTELD